MNVSYVEIFAFQGHSSSRNRTYNLTVNSRALYRLSYEGIYSKTWNWIPRFHMPAPPPNLPRPISGIRSWSAFNIVFTNVSQSTKQVWSSSSRNRTYNLTVNSRALYRLSYGGIKEYRKQDSNLRSHWLLQLECNPLDHSGIPAQRRFFCFYHIRLFFSMCVNAVSVPGMGFEPMQSLTSGS